MNYYVWIFPFFIGYIVGCYVIGKNLKELIPIKNQYVYWGMIMALPIASFITHSFVLGVLIHAFAFFIIKDIIVFISHKLNLRENKIIKKIYAKGLLVILLALILSIYGYYNAYDLRVKSYDIKTIKNLREEAKLMFVSDLHIGTINIDYELDFLVKEVNKEKPDVLVLGGDTFDEYTTKEEMEYTLQKFNEVNTKYGIYMIEGNHDMFSSRTKELIMHTPITLLEDESILINDNYYLVGRLDIRRNRVNSYKRKEYDELVSNLDKDKPIILLEHEPYIKDLKKEIIDLQLTGHTHNGQVFPGNLFVKYGYYKYGDSKMIVTSGLGEWNIPVRTAGHSEIIIINLRT